MVLWKVRVRQLQQRIGDLKRPRMSVTIAIAVSLVVGLWLSSNNSQQYRLVNDEGMAQIEKGLFMPWGYAGYIPSEIYRPIVPSAGIPINDGDCADLKDCEARLFEVVSKQASRFLTHPKRLEAGKRLVLQATRLSNEGNRIKLLVLQGDEQHARGMAELREIRESLVGARENFKRAQSMNTRKKKANEDHIAVVERLITAMGKGSGKKAALPKGSTELAQNKR
jgi:hypothetical protein